MDLRKIAPAPGHRRAGMSAPQKFSYRRARVFLPARRSSQLLQLSYGVCSDLGMIFTE
jgi:hypothetical protein